MKVFLVFIGLMLVNVTFIAYQGDLHRYLRIQEFLKATAEECACGAAQYYDEEAYSSGVMKVNEAEAEKYVKYIEAKAGAILTKETGGILDYQMEITGGAAGEPSGPPAVAVRLTYTAASDLFRLPFLSAEQVTRAAKYELVCADGE